MTKRFSLELDLPDEVVLALRDEELSAKAKESLVLELLREHHISEGTAGHILSLNRGDLMSLMSKYQIPVIDMTSEELREELNKPLPL